MRKIIAAYNTLDKIDLPDFKAVDACWARMIGAGYLQAIIKYTSRLDHTLRLKMRDRVFKLAEPSIILRYNQNEDGPRFQPEVGQSRYFGNPDMPEEMS